MSLVLLGQKYLPLRIKEGTFIASKTQLLTCMNTLISQNTRKTIICMNTTAKCLRWCSESKNALNLSEYVLDKKWNCYLHCGKANKLSQWKEWRNFLETWLTTIDSQMFWQQINFSALCFARLLFGHYPGRVVHISKNISDSDCEEDEMQHSPTWDDLRQQVSV